MTISAHLRNGGGYHSIMLRTGDSERMVAIAPKASGLGSSVNGGELLFLALATCYCNDIYREAGKRGIVITSVDVNVFGEFGAEGEPARRIEYSAMVQGVASEEELFDLMEFTDTVSEIQNTLRRGAPVVLSRSMATPSGAGDPTS